MIVFNNWKITHTGDLLARQYDNLSRTLLVKGVPEGYDWKMMVQVGGNFDILTLAPMEEGVGIVLTKDQLSISGYYTMQLVGTLRADGVTVRHTDLLRAFVSPSLSGDANWPTVPSEFSQIESNIKELNEHPSIPGENGYWLVWDLETHAYAESEFPLPEVSAGPPGEDGKDGVTFTPSVSETGVLSWTNDGGLENPASVSIRGPAGADGNDGKNGTTFTPEVSAAGIISWTNDGGLANPTPVSIVGPAGKDGQDGAPGQDGADGVDGAAGKDGVGIQSVEQTTTSTVDGGVNVVTVTKTDGTSTTFEVRNGSQGNTGPAGADGKAGSDGADGYTPQRGVDYWTAEDQQTIVDQVLAALPDGDEVSY